MPYAALFIRGQAGEGSSIVSVGELGSGKVPEEPEEGTGR